MTDTATNPEEQQDAPPVDGDGDDAEAEPPAPSYSEEDAEQARMFGWKSPDEWVGEKPATYVDDPKEYLQKVEKSPIFKAFRGELDKVKTDHQRKLERLESLNQKALERQKGMYEQQIAALENAKLGAVESGDIETYTRLDRQQKAVEGQMAEPKETEAPQVDPSVRAYVEANDWAKDPVLWQEATALVSANPQAAGTTPEQQLAYAEQQIKRLHPERFEPVEKLKPTTSKVDGGGLGGSFRAKSPFDGLPQDAKQQFKRFVDKGIFKDTAEDRKEYADEYNAS